MLSGCGALPTRTLPTTTPAWGREGRPHTMWQVLRMTENQHSGIKYNGGRSGACLRRPPGFLERCFFHPLLEETVTALKWLKRVSVPATLHQCAHESRKAISCGSHSPLVLLARNVVYHHNFLTVPLIPGDKERGPSLTTLSTC